MYVWYVLLNSTYLLTYLNTLHALVLGGVHSTVASRANVLATNTGRRCLNSYHAVAKHCKMNTFPLVNNRPTLQWLPRNILFSKVYASQISEETLKFALKLASICHMHFDNRYIAISLQQFDWFWWNLLPTELPATTDRWQHRPAYSYSTGQSECSQWSSPQPTAINTRLFSPLPVQLRSWNKSRLLHR